MTDQKLEDAIILAAVVVSRIRATIPMGWEARIRIGSIGVDILLDVMDGFGRQIFCTKASADNNEDAAELIREVEKYLREHE